MVIRRIRTIIPRWRKRREGQALVEFALVAPLFLLLVIGVVEFGQAWNVYQSLADAAREGCRTAVVYNPTTTINTVVNTMNQNMASARIDTTSAVKTITGFQAGTGTPATCSISYPYQLRWIQGLMGWTGAQASVTLTRNVTFRNE